MFALDDVLEGVLGGSTTAVGVVALAAIAVVGGPRFKPLAKGAIVGYLTATQKVREWVAEAGESVQDLYAEAKYEYESGGDGDERVVDVQVAPRRARRTTTASEQPA